MTCIRDPFWGELTGHRGNPPPPPPHWNVKNNQAEIDRLFVNNLKGGWTNSKVASNLRRRDARLNERCNESDHDAWEIRGLLTHIRQVIGQIHLIKELLFDLTHWGLNVRSTISLWRNTNQGISRDASGNNGLISSWNTNRTFINPVHSQYILF